jgi:hypothetical protein
MSKETLIVDLPDEPEVVKPSTPAVSSQESNELIPNSWKKLLLLAVSYGLAIKLEESPGALTSIVNMLPTPFIAQMVLTATIYVVVSWLIRKFNLIQLD